MNNEQPSPLTHAPTIPTSSTHEDGEEANRTSGEQQLDEHSHNDAEGGQQQLLRQLIEMVSEVRDLLMQEQIRDYYSLDEVARILGKAVWTVREWCRLGRVHAEKKKSGRGRSQEWVISHTELLRIRKDGLLPSRKY